MGVSTDAKLFWGYCFDAEGEYPWRGGDEDAEDGDFDSDERYAIAVGVKRPEKEYDENDKAVVADYHRFWGEKRKAAKRAGCEVGYHCSDEFTMYYVAVTESHKVAHRGCPEEISQDHFDVPETWHKKLDDYCEKMGIKTRQKPKWWLCSYWG